MNELFRPGAGFLFMKVGTHAQESLADIVARKRKEIEKVGHTLWGYGGNTCHPTTMVQPFARNYAERSEPIHLVMEEMESKHFAEPMCAAELSVDGLKWDLIPNEIEVRGSRHALVIRDLQLADFSLPLNQTFVPVGPSRGRLGSRYVMGRVDKACLEFSAAPELTNEDPAKLTRPINLVAELVEPYAVFLRNFRQ
ncbi:hypothetical protein GGQ86_000783 [Xanthobacter flavus]|uniref:Uncharacterized protein n=1 Tax=Xanthobacter flavus TaxID=281 RepID=A0A9W6FJ72_XANFL|nr:hypothetical protein [Xanthobacter flavus]MDR6332336.1 hypothetical protein [Xanthobacter flavus]GLI21915.1 hypothetical protein XFLAVUS301_15890 [Xanthobacter flavus]